MLQIEHISKSFGSQRVLDDINFSLAAGEVAGILGNNGAGKTTLLRIVCRLLAPDSGRVLFDGHTLGDADLAHIGYLPEERGLYRHMRVKEQALYLAQLKGITRHDAEASIDDWFQRLGMTSWADKHASELSKGMQQRLQFVVAVAHRPQLLILDEPFSGFDADNAEMLRREIARLAADGTAVLLSTHNTAAAKALCNKTLQL